MNIKTEIHQIDCISFLNSLQDNSVNLAVIDPPYNLSKADWDTFPSHNSFLKFTYMWIDALIPKLNVDGSLYIFNTPYNSAFIMQYLVSKGLLFKNWITWDKRDGMGSAKRKYSSGQETVLFFTKSDNHTFNFNDIRVQYESTDRIKHAAKKGILKNGKRWFPNPDGKFCGEVWHFPSARHSFKINGKLQKMAHVTPKPIEMIERMIIASSNPQDLVIDCFLGSGTTALASKKLRRNFAGADINLDYINFSQNRLNNYDYSTTH